MISRHLHKYRLFAVSGTLLLLTTFFYLEFFSPHALREWVNRVDGLLYDVKVRTTLPEITRKDPPILIVDIDENSLKEEGRWPWSRIKIAKLVDRLSEAGAMMLAFDVVFSEPEENAVDVLQGNAISVPPPINAWLLAQKEYLDADNRLAASLNNTDTILGALFHKAEMVRTGQLVIPFFDESKGAELLPEKMVVYEYSGYSAPISELMDNAIGTGAINSNPDNDGVVRRSPLLVKYADNLYPSLAMETARQYLLEETINVGTATIGEVQTITHITLGGKDIPTDAKGNILIPYIGRAGTFKTISATAVLNDDEVLEAFENAIAFVGTSALALADLRPTPISGSFPGVEIQASILNGLLHPELLASEPDWLPGALAMLLMVIGLILILVMPLVSVTTQPVIGIFLAILVVLLNYWFWNSLRINMPLFSQIGLIFAATAMFTIESLVRETHEKLKIRDSFGQYVPPQHIERLQGGGWDNSLKGERREMTVLFSDIRSFTQLSEGLDASQLREFLNQYLTPITKIIFDSGGTIDKYVGDMVMAFWNAPIDDPDHPSHAVHAALKMKARLESMQGHFREMGLPKVAAGIGIHTGDMNVGDMGSEYRRAYTVLGDAVNLGSRLESLTKFYGVAILTSEETRVLCPDVSFRYIDCVRVKGKETAVKMYEPLWVKGAEHDEAIDEVHAVYMQGVDHYLKQEWEKAEAVFRQLSADEPDELIYRIYLERSEDLLRHPPGPDWDGIYTHTSK
jgi:adenylate cyclase